MMGSTVCLIIEIVINHFCSLNHFETYFCDFCPDSLVGIAVSFTVM